MQVSRPVRVGLRLVALGYLLDGEPEERTDGGELREVEAVVSGPMLTPDLLELAEQIATPREYCDAMLAAAERLIATASPPFTGALAHRLLGEPEACRHLGVGSIEAAVEDQRLAVARRQPAQRVAGQRQGLA